MPTETCKIFAVMTNTDLTEGRGTEYAAHLCYNKSTALRLAKGAYVMGSDARVAEVETTVVDGRHYIPTYLVKVLEPTTDDERADKKREEREKAFKRAKELGLTEQEILILGGKA